MALGRKRKSVCKNKNMAAHNAARSAQSQQVGAKRGRPRSTSPPRERTRKATRVTVTATTRKRRRTSEALERGAISFMYSQLGSPPAEEWKGRNGTAAKIMKTLDLDGTPRMVIRTLESCAERGADWDPKAGSMRGGRKPKLSTVECEIAADMLAQGLGLSQTLYNLNDLRAKHGRSSVGRTTLRRNVKTLLSARRQKTVTRPTGKKDVNSPWAVNSTDAARFQPPLGRDLRHQNAPRDDVDSAERRPAQV